MGVRCLEKTAFLGLHETCQKFLEICFVVQGCKMSKYVTLFDIVPVRTVFWLQITSQTRPLGSIDTFGPLETFGQ